MGGDNHSVVKSGLLKYLVDTKANLVWLQVGYNSVRLAA